MSRREGYLKEWRHHRHLTQAQVVNRLDIYEDDKLPRTEASLSRIENGEQNYSIGLLMALADIYNCEVWELHGRKPGVENQLIDLVQRLDPAGQERARAVIEGLVVADERLGYTPPPTEPEPLKPKKRKRAS